MASKSDILELYGLPPTDPQVAARLETKVCPFTKNRCVRIERGSSAPTGVCSVSVGATRSPAIICENRFLGDWLATLRLAASESFGVPRFIAGGSKLDMANRLAEDTSPAVLAFKDVTVMGKSKVTFDYILQHYDYHHKRGGFVAAQILPNEITGSYRACLESYRDFHAGRKLNIVASQHTVNFSPIMKKLLPEIIRKGMILSQTDSCYGNYLIMPDAVLQKLDPIFSEVGERAQIAPHILSVRAYAPDTATGSGVRVTRTMNLDIKEIATAFYARADEKACSKLESTLKNIL
jgi:hypothetical protein